MSTKDNRSIVYIYNEMDPSEKLEFERDLENNSDLLIEVESLRNVSNQLNKLQQVKPPAHVVNAVCETAKERSSGSKNNPWRVFIYSAAALLLVGLTSGIFLISNQNADDNSDLESASVAGTPTFSAPVSAASTSSGNLEPWVDNNEIIYFRGNVSSVDQASIDSIKSNSLRKLTPINPSFSSPYDKQLQLTGSNN